MRETIHFKAKSLLSCHRADTMVAFSRMVTDLWVFLLLHLLLLQSASGNTKKAVLEQEVVFLRDNLTTVWEVLSQMRSQIERLESEEKVHHHHHHYHHFYHNDSSYPDGEQSNHTHEVLVNHERTKEMQHVHVKDGSNHDPSTGDHHHYHHFIHHHHPKNDEGGELYGEDMHGHENGNGHRQCLLPNGKNGGKNHNHNGGSIDLCGDDDGEAVLAEAICQMKPNRALPLNERQNVRGTVTFRQKNSNMEILLNLRGFLTSPKHAHHGQHLDLHVHGLHVHEFGDLSNGCESAGAHYNPLDETHGGPESTRRHVGDFGNVKCDDEGKLELKITDSVASLTGTHSVIGKTLVIHENADDLGMFPDDEGSVSNGNAGRRLACCVITKKGD